MNCINMKIKTKKGKKLLYCNLLKKEITFDNCKDCANKEYKKVKCTINRKNCAKYHFPVNGKTIKGKKHKLTKATEIPMKVKKIVWERDNRKCIYCNKEVPLSCANSHYIKRSQLRLGIPQNIVCACPICHDKYDFGINIQWMIKHTKKHLKLKYKDWNEDILTYKKS